MPHLQFALTRYDAKSGVYQMGLHVQSSHTANV